jgi:hypothetical protein
MHTVAIQVGVVMQRLPLNNRWQSHQWRPFEIVNADVLQGGGARCLLAAEEDTRWVFGNFEIRLFADEAEGYFLNINADHPCWFIMWRIEQIDGVDVAVPKSVTLSYNEAARLMDGGEQVDNLPLPLELIERIAAFTSDNYHPQVKRKRKKPSFEGGAGVDKMAKAEGKSDGR